MRILNWISESVFGWERWDQIRCTRNVRSPLHMQTILASGWRVWGRWPSPWNWNIPVDHVLLFVLRWLGYYAAAAYIALWAGGGKNKRWRTNNPRDSIPTFLIIYLILIKLFLATTLNGKPSEHHLTPTIPDFIQGMKIWIIKLLLLWNDKAAASIAMRVVGVYFM